MNPWITRAKCITAVVIVGMDRGRKKLTTKPADSNMKNTHTAVLVLYVCGREEEDQKKHDKEWLRFREPLQSCYYSCTGNYWTLPVHVLRINEHSRMAFDPVWGPADRGKQGTILSSFPASMLFHHKIPNG